ncbi:hypothetical protein FYK55_09035 [Roseiconus nitratireducens]|uniref:AsmA-like C-terminal domain-containing protein n=1 Tax=Roseiconus nitratireducens TaxID=2605748 RepID=A0A5M6DGU7_9BACT|nr:hypothetical protein [Roseiconus nitratireducens]KAA5544465.1 hypothetical protein FYK55_09035 [Roseiconus nitratireducens]
MHERTQRAVARLLFVFCCALPSSGVLLAILITWTPWYQNRQLARITYQLNRETGLVFQIDGIRQIAPGKYVLDNVRLNHPETGHRVATVRTVDYFAGPERIGILLHQPELQSSGLGRAWNLLHDRVISRPEHTLLPISIAATDLTIRSRTGSLSLRDVSVSLNPEADGVRMFAEAGDAMASIESLVRVTLFRDRSGPVPTTELVVSTGETSLPCSALAEFSTLARQLGDGARFTGTMKCRQHADGWSYDLGSSSVTGIELSKFSEDLPHRVTGTADLRLQRAVIEPGKTVNVAGTFHARDGWIGRSLLRSMQERLGFSLEHVEEVSTTHDVQYALAAFHFSITDESMSINGICGPNRDYEGSEVGVALCAHGLPIVRTGGDRFFAEQIIATIAPPGRDVSRWHQVFLPAPPALSESGQPAAAIRRARAWSGGETIQQR